MQPRAVIGVLDEKTGLVRRISSLSLEPWSQEEYKRCTSCVLAMQCSIPLERALAGRSIGPLDEPACRSRTAVKIDLVRPAGALVLSASRHRATF